MNRETYRVTTGYLEEKSAKLDRRIAELRSGTLEANDMRMVLAEVRNLAESLQREVGVLEEDLQRQEEARQHPSGCDCSRCEPWSEASAQAIPGWRR